MYNTIDNSHKKTKAQVAKEKESLFIERYFVSLYLSLALVCLSVYLTHVDQNYLNWVLGMNQRE